MAKIFYITGPIQSRKTTKLASWCNNRTDAGGLLSPVLPEGRTFLNVRTKEQRLMEAGAAETEVQKVGRFTFSAKTFAWANQTLLDTFLQNNLNWLVIDEIGPLELRGQGLYPALEKIFRNLPEHVNLILVIRETLLEEVLHFFDLKRYSPAAFDFPAN